MLRKIIFFSGVLGLLAYCLWSLTDPRVMPETPPEGQNEVVPVSLSDAAVKAPPEVSPTPGPPQVPFTVQAPTGKWQDPDFQNACEEASLLMAARFIRSDEAAILPSAAVAEIKKLVAFQKKKWGHAVDTSATDTLVLFQEFYKTTAGTVAPDITLLDIKKALEHGNIVLVPADGQKLGNPHFTRPGPPRHMLVILGYDAASQEFITNDPGTRYGAGYRYPEAVLWSAILDYPTGKHAPVISKKKVMLSIER